MMMVAVILSSDVMVSVWEDWWKLGSGECVGNFIPTKARLAKGVF